MVAFRSADTSGRQSGLLLRCVLFCLLSIGLMILDKRYNHLAGVRRFLSVVVYPLEVAVASPFEGWAWLHESFSTRDALRTDKTRLEQELRMARFRLQRYDAMETEVRQLRALRENTAGVTQKFIVGDVMNVDLDAFRARIIVDKGARDGVFVGQAVLDDGGVFGQVARVSELTCEVILISDAAHAIPAQDNRNGLRTVVVGTGDPNHLKLPYVSTAADIVKGDLLVTSGLGGVFPAGYPVGTVVEVRRDPAASLAEIDVQPAAALDRSRHLLLIWVSPPAPSTEPAPKTGAAAK
jgi:rod shape-determining protein MreC